MSKKSSSQRPVTALFVPPEHANVWRVLNHRDPLPSAIMHAAAGLGIVALLCMTGLAFANHKQQLGWIGVGISAYAGLALLLSGRLSWLWLRVYTTILTVAIAAIAMYAGVIGYHTTSALAVAAAAVVLSFAFLQAGWDLIAATVAIAGCLVLMLVQAPAPPLGITGSATVLACAIIAGCALAGALLLFRRWLRLGRAQLVRAGELAEEAVRAKSEFLANISHEIRTPLNGVMAMTELLLTSKLTPAQRENLEIIKESSDSLLSLLTGLLDLSSLSAGKLALERTPFDLHELLRTSLTTIGRRAESRGVELSWEVERTVSSGLIGDPERLAQVLVQLVNNAVKFTPEGGSVTVRIANGPWMARTAILHITVTDTGIGIPPAMRKKIFDLFAQGDDTTSRLHGGAGLGLALCAQLVHMMQGRIWVDSEVGKGSTFHLIAHFWKPNDAAGADDDIQSIATGQMSKQRLHVLIAEDEPVNRAVAMRLVESMGHTLVAVQHGKEVIQAMESQSFDLVLLDVEMPIMDGVETVKAIREREQERGTHVPVVALTAHAMSGDERRLLDAGMDAYIAKPIRSEVLLGTIERLLTAPEVGDSAMSIDKNVPPRVPAAGAHEGSEPAMPAHPDSRSLRSDAGAGSTAAGAPSLPVFDRSVLQELVGDDDELMREIVSGYREQRRDLMHDLRTALQDSKSDVVRAHAHKLKGTLLAMGAPAATHAAGELEMAGRAGDLEQARMLEPVLEHALCDLDRTVDTLGFG